MARGEEGLQVLRNHCVEHRIAGITRRVGGNRWRHNSPHRQQGEDESARSCPPIYCSNVQYTSKKLTRECGGNMRDASPCRAAVAKSAFGIPVHKVRALSRVGAKTFFKVSPIHLNRLTH